MAHSHVGTSEVTRAITDGDCDAIGEFSIGSPADQLLNQIPYARLMNRLSVHGKEKVYGSIP
ncbi:MAG TPA: hypothetical protein VH024_06265 [Candidatus Angelobacter sp.]|nr:hypothetical protein [Candidatus Angelobacter sp.]